MKPPRMTVARTMVDGVKAIAISVRGPLDAEMTALLDSLGYELVDDLAAVRRIVCTTPEQIDAARYPLRGKVVV